MVAVRSLAKGEAAKAETEAQTNCTGVIEVWELDYFSYASVKAFASRATKLDRRDASILNAGTATENFEIFEDNESSITVNVVSTTLLALLLLPALRSSVAKWIAEPVLTIVGSGVHAYTNFTERNTPKSFKTLNNPQTANMSDRYPVTKLLQLFAVRSLSEKLTASTPFVAINTVNPGL
ncbi:hypothetical protein MMC28_006231 [Mycoblastus sanguinarius]|nr:hypothetical protein [Mycoblastus sanguinarius]